MSAHEDATPVEGSAGQGGTMKETERVVAGGGGPGRGPMGGGMVGQKAGDFKASTRRLIRGLAPSGSSWCWSRCSRSGR